MSNIIARVVVVLRSAVTWLTLAATVLGVVAVNLEPFTTDPTIARIVAFIAAAMGVVAVIVRIISQVTPVLEDARGLLPPVPGTAVTAREAELVAELETVRDLTP